MPDESTRPEKICIKLSSWEEYIDNSALGNNKREMKQPNANGINKLKSSVATAWMIGP